MTQLSKNFSDHEFACKCCGQIRVNPALVDALQALRDATGIPIHILSGYRCPAHNKAVGGVKNSQHLQGNAADISMCGVSVANMYYSAVQIPAFNHGGIGCYHAKGFIHLDVRGKRARWHG